MMNGEMVFGADLEKGSKDVGTCYKTSRVDPLESVEVCGVNMKVIVYLPNDCLQADPHNVEVLSFYYARILFFQHVSPDADPAAHFHLFHIHPP